jgi:CubicO group peptidase (beta-lactamase class C family)
VLIERVCGQALPDVLAERVFGPLGMVDTGFVVPRPSATGSPATTGPARRAAWSSPTDPTGSGAASRRSRWATAGWREIGKLFLYDPDPVQADWVGAIWRTSAEDTGGWSRGIIPRPGDQHAAIGLVKPGQQDYLRAGGKVAHALGDFGLEDHPGVRRTFVALPWRLRLVLQRRLHPSDGHHPITGHVYHRLRS